MPRKKRPRADPRPDLFPGATRTADRPYMVRCLGPGAEHYFASADRCRERICYTCRVKLDALGVTAASGPSQDNARGRRKGKRQENPNEGRH